MEKDGGEMKEKFSVGKWDKAYEDSELMDSTSCLKWIRVGVWVRGGKFSNYNKEERKAGSMGGRTVKKASDFVNPIFSVFKPLPLLFPACLFQDLQAVLGWMTNSWDWLLLWSQWTSIFS